MYQNVKETVNVDRENKIKRTFAKVFSIKYILIYIIAFMISMVPLAGEASPFSISIMVACFANAIPAIGVIAVSLIGSAIKFGIDGALNYLLTTIMLVITLMKEV